MTRLLFEQSRESPADGSDGAESPAVPSAPTAADAGAHLPQAAAEPAPVPKAEADESPLPKLLPAGEPVQTAAAQPDAPPEPAAYGIHLASFGSEANARKSWLQLQAQFPDLLSGKNLALRSVDLGDRGVFVRVVAVPFADSAAARTVCRDLERRAQYCAVLRPD